jgi:hypothetical protein
MAKRFLSCIFVLIASVGHAQKAGFFEQLGMGYSSGPNATSFSEKGNEGGFAFGTTGDFFFRNLIGLGVGFDVNVISINHSVKTVSPLYADFKIVARGKYRPYIVVDPGYCFYYNSIADGTTQKGSFYTGGGVGIWFPSKRLLHLFLQAKYNYLVVTTNINGSSGSSSSGYLSLFSFLLGYKF